MGGVPFTLCFPSFKFSNENRLLYVQESLLNSGTSVWLLPPNINLIHPSLCNVNKAEQPSGSTINCSPGRELIFIEWFQCAQPWRDPGIVSGGGSAWTMEEKYCQVRHRVGRELPVPLDQGNSSAALRCQLSPSCWFWIAAPYHSEQLFCQWGFPSESEWMGETLMILFLYISNSERRSFEGVMRECKIECLL